MERKTKTISRFDNAKDNIPKRDTIPQQDFLQELLTPTQLGLSYEDFFGGTDDDRRRFKSTLPAFSPADFGSNSSRASRNVHSLSYVVLDLDDENRNIDDIAARMTLRRWLGVIHTTISDKGVDNGATRCFRVILA